MKKFLSCLFPVALLSVGLLAGCKGYTWKSQVPADMRTVSVPVFVNESSVTELGNVVTRQVLREFQREGTMKIARFGESAVEVQGVIKKSSARTVAYERKTGARNREHDFGLTAVVSIIDKRAGKVLVDNRRYVARTTFLAHDDMMTAERDASGRIAEDLARQIVDDVLAQKWDVEKAASNEAGKEQ